MTSAIIPGSEPDDVRLREVLRFVSIPRNDSPGPADEPGAARWDIATTTDCSGVSAHTLRYYERIKLVRVDRDVSGHRHHDTAAVRRLVSLTRMWASGMPIRDLWCYTGLVEAGWDMMPEHLVLLIEHREGLRAWIDELWLALAATEYKTADYTRELERQAVSGNINTPNTNISNTDKEIPS